MSSSTYESLQPLFRPETVAIIGASRSAGKHGNRPIGYLKRAGFAGEVYPINPAGGEIEGYKVYESLAAAPRRIDCALMVIPATAALEAMRECAAAGVRSVVMGNTGFSELGTDEGREREAQVRRIAREAGIRIVGPNTNGLYNASHRLPLGYNTSHGEPLFPGPISFAAHSGALFNSIAPRLRQMGAGISKYVAVGTEADVTVLDLFDYYVDDPDTQVIGLILEAVSDGERFAALARRARQAGKPVVALKLGRSAAGAGATVAHSTRLAGSAKAYDAMFEQLGVARVPSVEALAGGCATLLSRKRTDTSRKLICVATTGGGASLLADYAEAHRMPLAGAGDGAWGGKVAERIASFEGAAVVRNPTDTSALGGHDRLTAFFEAQEADGFDGPMAVFTHMLPSTALSVLIATHLVARHQRTGAPMVVIAPGGLPAEAADAYRTAGIPLFLDTDTAFHSLDCHYQTAVGVNAAVPAPVKTGSFLAGHASGAAVLSELESAAILRAAGVAMVESHAAETIAKAVAAAKATGYPVVLKALAPGVAHKNHLGFVVAGLADEAALRDAHAALVARVKQQGFDVASVPVILQPMRRSKVEMIVGASHEPPFGHFLLLGLGGIYAEALDESLLLPLEASSQAMRDKIAATRIGRLLDAVGGGALQGTVAALEALQRLLLADGARIASIDVNPLLVGDEGGVAVDALVVLR